MAKQTYRIVVYRIEAQADDDDVTATTTPVASWCASALTAQDAVMQWGDQLAAEEASLRPCVLQPPCTVV